MWVYPLATTNGSMLGNWTQNLGGDHGMKISYGRAVASKFEFFYSSSGQSSPGVMVSANTYAANAWYHVAAVRVGSTVTLYVNGTSAVSGTYSNDMYEQYLYIGTENPGYNTTWFNGYISNLRIARYLAVYTGAFTPPTAPLSTTQTNSTNISAIISATTVTMLTLQNATSIVDNSYYARSVTVSGATTSTVQPFDVYVSVTASNLSPLTSYTFQAYGTNLVGDGDVSSTSSVITTYASPGSNIYKFPGTYSWVTPAGVTSVSVVTVGGGGGGTFGNSVNGSCYAGVAGGSSYFAATCVVRAYGGLPGTSNYTGGTGGTGRSGTGNTAVAFAGGTGGADASARGGGAGGYTGTGGGAGRAAGCGGSGAGGAINAVGEKGGGGGVGLFGLGSNGVTGSTGAVCDPSGGGGSGGTPGRQVGTKGYGGVFGGGGGGAVSGSNNSGAGGAGGGLAYVNNYTVNAAQSYTVVVGAGGAGDSSGVYVGGTGGNGGVRIVWPGQIRSFPSTAVVCYANSTSSQFVPNAPTITGISATSGTAIAITYTAPTYVGGDVITSYTAISSDGNYRSTTSTSGSGSILVRGLTPVTSYSFSVYATNLYGNSTSSSSLSTTTAVASGSAAYVIPGTYSWVVPTNVTSVSVVAVGGGASGTSRCNNTALGGASSFTMVALPNTVHVSASGGSGVTGGSVIAGTGFAGGAGGAAASSAQQGGGGGAGGYTAAGGTGGAHGANGAASTGGGGGGGGGGLTSANSGGGGGGGVGLFGKCGNGAGGVYSPTPPSPGTGGSCGVTGGYANFNLTGSGTGGFGGLFGGGGGGSYVPGNNAAAGGGGGLAYANNISVTPGASYTVVVGVGGTVPDHAGGNGGVRIVWPGQFRSFPSTNVAQGYDTDALTVSSTYVPRPPTLNSAVASNGTSILINFSAGSPYYITPITSYTAVATAGTTSITTTTASSGTVLISGLTPLTNYTVSVYATSVYGNSTSSNSISTTTYVASSSIAYTIPGTYTLVVPANVTAVSVISVGGGSSGRGLDGNNNNGGASSFTMAALPNTVHVSAGGGSGQTGGSVIAGTGFSGGGGGGAGCSGQSGGGGGAGGYTAAGGAGGGGAGNDGAASTGGGGGGGRGQPGVGGGGGGVGLFGKCGNGTGGVASAGPGTGGSNGTIGGYGNGFVSNVGGFGGFFGGGGGASFISGGSMPGGGGGALAYVNNVSVTAGDSYTVVVGAGGANTNTAGGKGAVRVVWPGQVRSFPSTNVAQGYDTDALTISNTYVPGAPILSSAVASSGTGITVNFTAPPSSYYITPITSYTAVATTGTTSISATTASVGIILILGLTPRTTYTVSVYANSVYGISTASITTQVTTLVASGENLYTTPGTFSWIAPANVTSVSVVAVGGGGGDAAGCTQGAGGSQSYFINSSLVRGGGGGRGTGYVYCYAGGAGGDYAGTGGGYGGAGGSGNNSAGSGGGGGAGGYSGAGGAGGTGSNSSGVYAADGAAGTGGAGGGGGFKYTLNHGGGGGVGVYGQGSSGAGGTSSYSGTGSGGGGGSGGATASDSDRLGGAYGGGSGSNGPRASSGGGGGGLGYLNNYNVSPGTSYAVIVGGGGATIAQAGGGAVRIIWPGNIRTFPSTLTGPSSNL